MMNNKVSETKNELGQTIFEKNKEMKTKIGKLKIKQKYMNLKLASGLEGDDNIHMEQVDDSLDETNSFMGISENVENIRKSEINVEKQGISEGDIKVSVTKRGSVDDLRKMNTVGEQNEEYEESSCTMQISGEGEVSSPPEEEGEQKSTPRKIPLPHEVYTFYQAQNKARAHQTAELKKYFRAFIHDEIGQ